MKEVHSYLAYIVLALLLLTVINALKGFLHKKEFKEIDLRLGLFTLIISHIQLLIGLIWYFMSPWFKALIDNHKEVLGDNSLRLLAVEHPFMMVISILILTLGWSKHKNKVTNSAKFKIFVIFYGLALVLMLSMIPWSNWIFLKK